MEKKLSIILEARDLASRTIDRARVAWARYTGAQAATAKAASHVRRDIDQLISVIQSMPRPTAAARNALQTLKGGLDATTPAKFREALRTARTEVERYEVAGKRLAPTLANVARESNRAGLATRVLRRAYSQLIGTIFIFFSAYRAIQLVKDSVKTYLDAATAAGGLKEKITALSDAWFQFKAQLGAAIVEMVGAQSQTSSLTQAIQTGAEWIGIHRDQIAAWGRLVGTVLRIVGSQIRLVFDLNVGLMRIIGATLTGIVLETSKAIAKAVNVGIDAINFLLGQYNSLPRAMRGPTVPTIPGFEAIDQVAGMAVEWNKISAEIGKGVDQLAEFDDNLVSIGRHVVSLKGDLAAIRKAGERPFDPFARPTDGAGGGGGGGAGRDEVQDFRRAEARRERAAGRALGPLQRRRMAIRGHEGLSGLGPVSGTEMSPTEGLDRISVPELPDATEGFRDGLSDAEAGIGAFFSAWQSGIAAFVEGSASLGEAFGGAITAGVAAAAGSRASFEMAEGVAALAKGIMGGPLAGSAFAAAAEHFKAAAMFGVLAGAAGGLGSAIGGGGGGGRGGRGGEIGRQHENGFGAASQGTTTIQLVGEGLNFRDPRQVRAFADMMAKASGNRVLVMGAGGRMSTIGTHAAAAARLPRGGGVHVWNS